MAFRDVDCDRARLEQPEIAVVVGWNLRERMKREVCGFLHRLERNKTNVVRLSHFFECPTDGRVTRQSPAAIGRAFERGNGGGRWKARGDCALL